MVNFALLLLSLSMIAILAIMTDAFRQWTAVLKTSCSRSRIQPIIWPAVLISSHGILGAILRECTASVLEKEPNQIQEE